MATTNRFRVASTLPRKLEELGMSPAQVLDDKAVEWIEKVTDEQYAAGSSPR